MQVGHAQTDTARVAAQDEDEEDDPDSSDSIAGVATLHCAKPVPVPLCFVHVTKVRLNLKCSANSLLALSCSCGIPNSRTAFQESQRLCNQQHPVLLLVKWNASTYTQHSTNHNLNVGQCWLFITMIRHAINYVAQCCIAFTGEAQQQQQQQLQQHQPDPMRPLLGCAANPLHSFTSLLLGSPQSFGNKHQKAALQDLIREDDTRQMDALIAKLDSMRKMQPPAAPVADKGCRRDTKGAVLHAFSYLLCRMLGHRLELVTHCMTGHEVLISPGQ